MPSSAPSQLKRYNVKQRGSNTYKFQGFNERINSIHLNLHHHTALHASTAQSASIDPLSTDSHFAGELDRQRELDASAAFTACYRQLRPLCRSFALVMHNKQRIVRILVHSLSQPALLSPAPYLSLLTTLVRDLRYDIYPLFPYILTSLLALLQPSNPDHLHALFSALLYLFKYLSRQLTRDVVGVYEAYMGRVVAARAVVCTKVCSGELCVSGTESTRRQAPRRVRSHAAVAVGRPGRWRGEEWYGGGRERGRRKRGGQ